MQKQLRLCSEGAEGRVLVCRAWHEDSCHSTLSAVLDGRAVAAKRVELHRESVLEAGVAVLGLKGWWLVDMLAGGWAAGTGLLVGLSSSVWGWLDSGIGSGHGGSVLEGQM